MDATLNLLNLAGAIAFPLLGVHWCKAACSAPSVPISDGSWATRLATGSKRPRPASASPPYCKVAPRQA
jgi:hypothetical protein